METIYELNLHESVIIKTHGKGAPIMAFNVTRVASGWLYEDMNPNRTTPHHYFVPFDNSFQNLHNNNELL